MRIFRKMRSIASRCDPCQVGTGTVSFSLKHLRFKHEKTLQRCFKMFQTWLMFQTFLFQTYPRFKRKRFKRIHLCSDNVSNKLNFQIPKFQTFTFIQNVWNVYVPNISNVRFKHFWSLKMFETYMFRNVRFKHLHCAFQTFLIF